MKPQPNSAGFLSNDEKRRSRAPDLADYRCSLPGLAEFAARSSRGFMAEGEGFEPSVGCPTHDFQSCTFGLSVTSPHRSLWRLGGESGIRTHGGFPHIAFRVRRLRPLGHFSQKSTKGIFRERLSQRRSSEQAVACWNRKTSTFRRLAALREKARYAIAQKAPRRGGPEIP